MRHSWFFLPVVGFLSGCAAAAGTPGSGLFRQAEVLEQSSFEATQTGALLRAAGLEQQALDLYRRVDATTAIVASLNRLGRIRLAMGEVRAASHDFNEAYELAVVLGDGAGRAAAANNLGSLARIAEDRSLANSRFSEAIETGGATLATRATGLNNRALLRFSAGDRAGAREDLEQALAYDRAAENPGGEALRLRNLAAVDLQDGALGAAIRRLSQAHEIDRRREDASAIARDLEALAVARWAEGEDLRLALSERRRSYAIDMLQGAGADAQRQRQSIDLWCSRWESAPRPVDCVFVEEGP